MSPLLFDQPQDDLVPCAPDAVVTRMFGVGSPMCLPIPGEAPYARVVLPPRMQKLSSSRDFLVQDYAMAVPAVAGSSVTSATLRFQLPPDNVGWLQQLGIYVRTSLATTSLEWTVRINQGPVAGFDAVQNPPGIANAVILFFSDVQVRLPNNCLVDVVLTNLDGAAITAGGMLSGWYHSRNDEIRAFGETGVG